MLSDEWLPRYRLLENFTAKWNGNGNGNGNGNAYDRGDYNSSFALRAVELKRDNKQCLLDTPCRVTVNNKRHISTCKKSEEKYAYLQKHYIIKDYNKKLL